ncbi:hypothetical protein ES703_71546 [subsurface metagenome]
MSAAVHGVDAVGKAEDGLGKAVIILEGDLSHGTVHHLGNIDGAGMAHRPVAVKVTDKAGNAPLKVEGPLAIFTFIENGYFQLFIEVSHLPQALADGAEIVGSLAEYLLIGKEGNGGAGIVSLTNLGHLSLGHTLLIFLLVYLAVTPDVNAAPGGEGVDHRSAHAVQATGHLVSLPTEFRPGVQRGHHRLQRRQVGGGVNLYRNTAPVIFNPDGTILLKGDYNLVTAPGHGFVNAVIGNLIDQVVQSALVSTANVHARSQAHRLPSPQHMDILGGILGVIVRRLFRRLFLTRHRFLLPANSSNWMKTGGGTERRQWKQGSF